MRTVNDTPAGTKPASATSTRPSAAGFFPDPATSGRHLTSGGDASPGDQDSMEAYAAAIRELIEAATAAIRAEYDRLSPPATRAHRPREESLLAYADACESVRPEFDPRLLAKVCAETGDSEGAKDFADMADALDRRARRRSLQVIR